MLELEVEDRFYRRGDTTMSLKEKGIDAKGESRHMHKDMKKPHANKKLCTLCFAQKRPLIGFQFCAPGRLSPIHRH